MAKRCASCGKSIDVYAGHYVNAYGDPWQMKSHNAECYRKLVLQEQEEADVP